MLTVFEAAARRMGYLMWTTAREWGRAAAAAEVEGRAWEWLDSESMNAAMPH